MIIQTQLITLDRGCDYDHNHGYKHDYNLDHDGGNNLTTTITNDCE